jgi:hypothetical protein
MEIYNEGRIPRTDVHLALITSQGSQNLNLFGIRMS